MTHGFHVGAGGMAWGLACTVAVSAGSLIIATPLEQSAGAQRPRAAAAIQADVRAAFDRGTARAASVVLVDHRGEVLRLSMGSRVGGADLPADDQTVFRAASLSKPVFAVIVLRLVEEGRLDLDRPLCDYLPQSLPDYADYRDLHGDPRYRAITARLVLTHRSGFPNWRWQQPDRKLRVLFDPGTRFSYSGEGYRYLQFVLEHLTGSTIQALAERTLFGPLGLTRTSFVWRDEFAANCAIDRAPIEAVLGKGILAQANAAGSLLTTAHDYGRFLSAVMAGTALPAIRRDQMLAPAVSIAAARLFGPPAGTGFATGDERSPFWCLGWGGFGDAAGQLRFHVGYDSPEYANYAAMYPASRLGAVVLTAGGREGDALCSALAEALLGRTGTPYRWMGYD